LLTLRLCEGSHVGGTSFHRVAFWDRGRVPQGWHSPHKTEHNTERETQGQPGGMVWALRSSGFGALSLARPALHPPGQPQGSPAARWG
jgi:hypothetical protein